MSFRKGASVWVEDKDNAWVEAEVVDVKGTQAVVLNAKGKKITCPVGKLLPRDADAEHGGEDDMTKLTYLHEPGVLYNICRRYSLNEIYTYTGSILIAVNPFTKLPHLYNTHMMEQYKGVQFGDLSPHVFAVADASYRSMVNDKKSQSILVSGESGAGKTETTKLIMQYLTHVGGRASGDDRSVEQQVLESNPLLEAFGNARTIRNDNSSRFGKFVEIQFDGSGRISGAAIRTYLLERSRVVQITDPERNYHCFYQLCASGEDAEKYSLGHPSNFHYLNQSRTYELNGVSNSEEYLRTRRAMDIVGISHSDQEAIFRTLAGILHLGNIDFSPGKEHDSSDLKDEKSTFHLKTAASLFMCDPNLLLTTLCTRLIQTHEGSITKALDCAGAVASRDALAKTVYSRLFDWLVENINKSVGQDPDSRIQIGVLDIYGFECFKRNSFEQFCINFANEKLQQHFNEHVFKMEQAEYSKEEIHWSYIEFIDNQDVLDLIEKKPIGIISLLDEACMFPKSTHETFSMKLFQSFKAHTRLEKTKFSETDFTISHYAGKVTYQTDSFIDKNRDYIIVEHCNLLSSSKCHFVSGLFPSIPEESSRSSYKFSSVASRFKQQLQSLMETLSATEPHYIRCIKPNSLSLPQKFENQSVLHQLRCGGVLEAVRISLAGYPTRRLYSEFVDRFGILSLELLDGSFDEKTLAEKLLQKLKLENFQLGRSKVFLRAGQIATLDSRRAEVLDRSARLVQSRFHTFCARKQFVSARQAAVIVQAFCRGCLARTIFFSKKQLAAAIFIQKVIRSWQSQRTFMQLCCSAVTLQSCARGFVARQKFLCLKEHRAASLIQGRWRTWKAVSSFQNYKHVIVFVQSIWRQKLAKREFQRLRQEAREAGALREQKNKLEKRLEDAKLRLQLEKMQRVSIEESKLADIIKLQKHLESVAVELDTAKLDVANERNEKNLLLRQLESSERNREKLERKLAEMEKLVEDNQLLKSSVETLSKKNSGLEYELVMAQKSRSNTSEKLENVESKCMELQNNLNSLEEKLANLEDENRVLRQKALSVTPFNHRIGGFIRSIPEQKTSVVPAFNHLDQKQKYETPTPTKTTHPQSLSGSRKSRVAIAVLEDQNELLSRCIKEDLGFKGDKPIAACAIYKLLVHWHTFEAERTAIFDFIIEGINDVIKVGCEADILPYWLSNTSALLCLLQRNLRANGLIKTPSRRSSASPGQLERMLHGIKSYSQHALPEENITHIEARYPAILFKQQLTASLEKIFGLIRDNIKKEISPLLSLCIQAPKSTRTSASRTAKTTGTGGQQSSNQWDSIVGFLDSLMDRLHQNYVPSFFIRKLITQVFSFINMQLFNSLLLRRECCTFSNGEYVKSGLAELEKWISNAKEEFSGTSWHELNYIRQAVGFLVIHQKRKKTFDEICNDLCPALTVRQIYRICSMYWDDKYSTQSVSNEVIAKMKDIVSKDSQNIVSNFFLLDDDLSIPFSTEDISKAIPPLDISDVELPPLLRGTPMRVLPHRLELPAP